MKVYRQDKVAQLVTQCIEIYLVKKPQFQVTLDSAGLYDKLKAMFITSNNESKPIDQGDLKGVLLTKDWIAL